MYFADSMKVDLDIAGNQTARRLGGGGGGGGLGRNSRLGRAIVSSSKPPYYAGYCLAVTR